MYDRLETREGAKDVYRLAKDRARRKRDIERVKCVKDEGGRVLVEDENIRDRWGRYFSELMNEGSCGEEVIEVEELAHVGEAEGIAWVEVDKALRRTKSGKAVGPDGIPIEVWKLLGMRGVSWLTV